MGTAVLSLSEGFRGLQVNTLVGSLHVKSEDVTPLHSETQNAAIFQFSAEGTTLKSDSIP